MKHISTLLNFIFDDLGEYFLIAVLFICLICSIYMCTGEEIEKDIYIIECDEIILLFPNLPEITEIPAGMNGICQCQLVD